MGQPHQGLNRNAIGANPFAISRAVLTYGGFGRREPSILFHGKFFPALSDEVVVVAHDGVDGHAMRALRFADFACVTTVIPAETFLIGRQSVRVLG